MRVFDKTRHIIKYDTPENVVGILREYLSPNKTVGIYCSLEDVFHIQFSLQNNFTKKFLFTKIFLQDVENNEDKAIIIAYKKINRLYYWPNLFIKLKKYIQNGTICTKKNITGIQLKFLLGKLLFQLRN